jgi:NitT/TauT family transport system substrate-binding protein
MRTRPSSRRSRTRSPRRGAFAKDNADAARALLPEFLGMPEPAAANLTMEDFGPELNVDSIAALQELMVKFEFLEEGTEVDLDDLVIE